MMLSVIEYITLTLGVFSESWFSFIYCIIVHFKKYQRFLPKGSLVLGRQFAREKFNWPNILVSWFICLPSVADVLPPLSLLYKAYTMSK